MKYLNADEIKQRLSIVDLVSQSYQITGSGHTLSTKEHDSLKLFTKNNSFSWFSKSGPKGGPLGGSVIDWHMHQHRCDFRNAVKELSAMLTGGVVTTTPRPLPVQKVQKPTAEKWQDARWQADKRRMVDDAQERLHLSPEGAAGREYLLSRGLRSDMWLAYELGYAVVNNPNVGEKMPAIVVPWQRSKITALEFRFLTNDKKARFSCWGKRYLFGLNRTTGHNKVRKGRSNTIIFVEGPINAISIYQTAYHEFGLDVVSFGSQSSVRTPAVAKMIEATARDYLYQIIWADEADVALSAQKIMPGAYLVKSPSGRDANDMLNEDSSNDDALFYFLKEVLKRSD